MKPRQRENIENKTKSHFTFSLCCCFLTFYCCCSQSEAVDEFQEYIYLTISVIEERELMSKRKRPSNCIQINNMISTFKANVDVYEKFTRIWRENLIKKKNTQPTILIYVKIPKYYILSITERVLYCFVFVYLTEFVLL